MKHDIYTNIVSLLIGGAMVWLIDWSLKVANLAKMKTYLINADQARIESWVIPVMLLVALGIVLFELARFAMPYIKLCVIALMTPLAAYIVYYVKASSVEAAWNLGWPALLAMFVLMFVRRDKLALS